MSVDVRLSGCSIGVDLVIDETSITDGYNDLNGEQGHTELSGEGFSSCCGCWGGVVGHGDDSGVGTQPLGLLLGFAFRLCSGGLGVNECERLGTRRRGKASNRAKGGIPEQ